MALDYTDFSFSLYRGDDRTINVTAYQADAVTVQNITGWTLWFTAKLNILDTDAAAIFQRKTGAGLGITLTTPASGIATITLTAANTDSLLASGAATSVVLYCDLQGKDGAGSVATLATGKITVYAEITRATV